MVSNKLVSHMCECEMMLYDSPECSDGIKIDQMYIKSFASDYKYTENYMPIFYATLNVPIEIYDKFIEYQSDGFVYVRIQNYNKLESNAIHVDMINDRFMYFLPVQFNKSDEIGSDSSTQKARQKHIVLGLLNKDIIEKFKTPFNAVYPETSTEELLENIFEQAEIDTENLLMDEIEINTDYPSTFIMPPQDSIANAIDYLFRREPFYETNFQFFMDLEKTYLLNSTGVAREFSSMPTVSISISNSTDESLLYDGCVKDGESGSYIIYVNKAEVEFHIDTGTEKNSNKMIGVYTGQVSKIDVNTVAEQEQSSHVKLFDESGIQLTDIRKSILQNTIVSMILTKKNMDTRGITPDKCYLIDSPGYEDYCGKYLLLRKTEMIVDSGNEFITTTTLEFQRVAAQDEEEAE